MACFSSSLSPYLSRSSVINGQTAENCCAVKGRIIRVGCAFLRRYKTVYRQDKRGFAIVMNIVEQLAIAAQIWNALKPCVEV
jgi:hypothetical protein